VKRRGRLGVRRGSRDVDKADADLAGNWRVQRTTNNEGMKLIESGNGKHLGQQRSAVRLQRDKNSSNNFRTDYSRWVKVVNGRKNSALIKGLRGPAMAFSRGGSGKSQPCNAWPQMLATVAPASN
jgi:hypothetical protein